MVCQVKTLSSSCFGCCQYYDLYCNLLSSIKYDIAYRPFINIVCVKSEVNSSQCGKAQVSSLPSVLFQHSPVDYGMAFQTTKIKADLKKLTPAPDRPRIFMSNKTSKVVVVFPNGEVVEGRF